MKTLPYLLVLIIFISSCKQAGKSDNLSMDEKFVGQWLYYANIPSLNKPDDHTMDGITCPITKVENTEETYNMKLFTGNELTLTKKNDTTLTDVGSNMEVRYVQATQHIILKMTDDAAIEFSKLK